MSTNPATDERPTFHDHVKLRRLRMLSGMSQQQLATKAGKSQAHICNLERGKVEASAPALKDIADALGCTIADLARQEDAQASEVRP